MGALLVLIGDIPAQQAHKSLDGYQRRLEIMRYRVGKAL